MWEADSKTNENVGGFGPLESRCPTRRHPHTDVSKHAWRQASLPAPGLGSIARHTGCFPDYSGNAR